jgi:WD40 repeat protein
MTRLRLHLAFALAILPAADLGALPFPTDPGPPLPDGAVRRFGKAPPEPPAKKQPATDTGDVVTLDEANVSNPARRAAMAQTPDGKQLVVGDATGRIDVFEISTGRLARRLEEPGGDAVYNLAVSPDGRWLACARVKPGIQIWDLTAGRVEGTIALKAGSDRRRPGTAERLAFAPEGKVLFTGIDIFSDSADQGATAWEVPSGKRLWNVPGVGYNLAADPSGRWVLSSLLRQGPIRLVLLDQATGRVAGTLPIEPSWEPDGTAVDATTTLDRVFTPDGARLVTSHEDGTVRAWDPLAGREVARIRWGSDGSAEPGGLACSPDGRWAAVRSRGTVFVIELASGRVVHTIAGRESPIRELAFTRDGRGVIVNAGPAPILWSLSPKELPDLGGRADALWVALGSDDAAAAYRLQWALVAKPKTAVRLAADRVRPAELVLPRARFDRLVAGLDSPEFAQRERAERDLNRAGITVPPAWLRQALAAPGSEEVQARLRRVLGRREAPSPDQWRLERAVQVLELAGTPEAVALLKEWAAGPAGAVLTEEAVGALKRLAPRP